PETETGSRLVSVSAGDGLCVLPAAHAAATAVATATASTIAAKRLICLIESLLAAVGTRLPGSPPACTFVAYLPPPVGTSIVAVYISSSLAFSPLSSVAPHSVGGLPGVADPGHTNRSFARVSIQSGWALSTAASPV